MAPAVPPASGDARRHPVVELLAAAVRRDATPPSGWLEAASSDELLDVAAAHRVTPALTRYVAGLPGTPAALATRLRSARTEQVVRHLTTLGDLGPLGAALDDAGIAWVVVKGPVAAATLWPAPDMRDYLDLDVVVDPRRLGDVIELLLGLGAEQLDVNWGLIRRQMRAELTFLLPRGTVLDLHWHPVNGAPLRRALGWDVLGLLDRRRLVEVGSLRVPTLDPADTAVHMAYHAVHSGGYRLLWLADVAFALAAADPDDVVRRAEAARLGLMVRVAADRASRVLATPPLAWGSRRGGAWRAAMAALDARAGVPRPGITGRSGRLRVSSTRWSTASSAGALLAAGAVHAVRRPDARTRPADNPLVVADGDLAARRAYLATVAAECRGSAYGRDPDKLHPNG